MALSIMHNRYVVLALALLLSSCQSAGARQQAQPAPSAWQVLERVGEAHARAPGSGDWAGIKTGERIPAASTLVTGTGGRLILARADGQILVGPQSRLRLPETARKAPLEQTEGRVRYRIGRVGAAFAVATPALNLQARDTVLEVAIGHGGTEVTVEEGEARVATFDGSSVGLVPAGGSARAGGADDVGLMVRGAPEQTYERVEPVLASSRQPSLEPAAKRSLEAEIGGRATAPDAANTAPVAAAAAGPAKGSGGAKAPAVEPARADDGGKNLVVVPAGFRPGPDRPDPPSRRPADAAKDQVAFTDRTGASDDPVMAPPVGADADAKDAEPEAAENPGMPRNEAADAPPADTPADPFTGFTDGLLGSLPAVSPNTR